MHTFLSTYRNTLTRLKTRFIIQGRMTTYLGNGNIMTLSPFGHSYLLNTSSLDAIKPLLSPSASDLGITALCISLVTPDSRVLTYNLSSPFHTMNLAYLSSRGGQCTVIDPNEARLFSLARDLYLNDLYDHCPLNLGSLIPNNKNCSSMSKEALNTLYETLEVQLNQALQTETSLSCKDIDLEKLIIRDKQTEPKKLCGFISDDEIMSMKLMIIDSLDQPIQPEEGYKEYSLLNPYLSMITKLYPSFLQDREAVTKWVKSWKEIGYEVLMIPNLQSIETYSMNPAYARWVFLVKASAFN